MDFNTSELIKDFPPNAICCTRSFCQKEHWITGLVFLKSDSPQALEKQLNAFIGEALRDTL